MQTVLAPHTVKQLSPHACRWMVFVDGENLAIRAKSVFVAAEVDAPPNGRWYAPDVFLWFPQHDALQPIPGLGQNVFDLAPRAVRSHYYTSVRGDGDALTDTRRRLKALGFDPQVFKKEGQRKAKGVDIALSKDLLSHAFLDNYDVAVLVAGDGDYVPLLQEIKRLGRRVCVAFFRDFGLSEELELQADAFFDVTALLLRSVAALSRPRPEPHQRVFQCEACYRTGAFSEFAVIPGMSEIPFGWTVPKISGRDLILCDKCSRRAGTANADPIIRTLLRSRGVPPNAD